MTNKPKLGSLGEVLQSLEARSKRLLGLPHRSGGEADKVLVPALRASPSHDRVAVDGANDGAEPDGARGPRNGDLGGAHHLVLIPIRSGLPLHIPVAWAKTTAGAILGRRAGGRRLHVEEATVSKDHARLLVHGERGDLCMLEDLGSLNGSYVNGVRVLPFQPTAVGPGDVLRFGGLEYLLAGRADPRGGAVAGNVVLQGVHPTTGEPLTIAVDHERIERRGFALIGRDVRTCDYLIDHRSVSREGHAKLQLLRGQRVAIGDAGSTNGVIVNGFRVPADCLVPLVEGAMVELGAISLTVVRQR
jgi:pSer/pThr/pTyr-binding forkhead associated (FHA) protein